jgi:hypothetical protein
MRGVSNFMFQSFTSFFFTKQRAVTPNSARNDILSGIQSPPPNHPELLYFSTCIFPHHLLLIKRCMISMLLPICFVPNHLPQCLMQTSWSWGWGWGWGWGWPAWADVDQLVLVLTLTYLRSPQLMHRWTDKQTHRQMRVIRMHPYLHPQHMKVVNYLINVIP